MCSSFVGCLQNKPSPKFLLPPSDATIKNVLAFTKQISDVSNLPLVADQIFKLDDHNKEDLCKKLEKSVEYYDKADYPVHENAPAEGDELFFIYGCLGGLRRGYYNPVTSYGILGPFVLFHHPLSPPSIQCAQSDPLWATCLGEGGSPRFVGATSIIEQGAMTKKNIAKLCTISFWLGLWIGECGATLCGTTMLVQRTKL